MVELFLDLIGRLLGPILLVVLLQEAWVSPHSLLPVLGHGPRLGAGLGLGVTRNGDRLGLRDGHPNAHMTIGLLGPKRGNSAAGCIRCIGMAVPVTADWVTR